jgi:AmmeMemoRadiSam system protein B
MDPWSAHSKPRLRAVETIVVPDGRHGRLLVLRDTQGIAPGHAALPPLLVAIAAKFTGDGTCAEIARACASETGVTITVDDVVHLARELDRALLLDSDAFADAEAAAHREFALDPLRRAAHAGGAYPGGREELEQYIGSACLGAAAGARRDDGHAVALVAPHIDPWRGALSYGHAYDALARRRAKAPETVLVFGTSHAPLAEAYALCNKSFETPFGALAPAQEVVARLANASTFDAFAGQFNHKREHSIEFQAVFLAFGATRMGGLAGPRIVPVLAGLGEHIAEQRAPWKDDAVRRFLDAAAEWLTLEGERALVIAGADLAHVGPRFGDRAPYDVEARTRLRERDRQSMHYACMGDPRAFWEHVLEDLDTRRVCGLAAVYSLLEVVERAGIRASGSLEHYEQTIDGEDGSIVSHAAATLSAVAP